MHLDFKISFNFTEFWYFTDNENMNVLFTVTGLPHLLISIIHKWISTFDFFFMPDQCCNRTNRKVVLLHSKHFYFIWYLNLKNENVLWTVTGLPWNCPAATRSSCSLKEMTVAITRNLWSGSRARSSAVASPIPAELPVISTIWGDVMLMPFCICISRRYT